MKARRLTSTVVGIGLVLTACGGQDTSPDVAAPTVTAPASDVSAEAISPADDQTPSTEPAVVADVVTSEPTDAEPAPPAPDEAPAAPALLQFSAPLVGGGELDAASLADKPTVFWFWAPT